MEAIIPGIIIFIILVIAGITHWKLVRKNNKLPVIMEEGLIVKKRVDKWRSLANSPMIQEYYVTVEMKDKSVDLKVTRKKVYDNLSIGQRGIVSYQEKRLFKLLVDFESE